MTRDECLACLEHLQRRQFRCVEVQTPPLIFGKHVVVSCSDPWSIYVWDKHNNRIELKEASRALKVKRDQIFDWKEWS